MRQKGEVMKYKSMLKSELADAAGVSRKTFTSWLIPHRKKLAELGVNPYSKVLPPKAVKYICETFDIET